MTENLKERLKIYFSEFSFDLSKRNIRMGSKCLRDSISMSKTPVLLLMTMTGLFFLWKYSLDSAGHY